MKYAIYIDADIASVANDSAAVRRYIQEWLESDEVIPKLVEGEYFSIEVEAVAS